MGEFLVLALGSGVQGGHVKQLPTKVILAGHFTRADIPAFSDFSDWQSLIANVRNSFISLDQCIYLDLQFDRGQTVTLQVQLRDTVLLAPAGLRSLADIGDIVGLPKMTLDPDPVKERQIKGQMHLLRQNNWPLFREYAIHDAVICREYIDQIGQVHQKITGKQKIPSALSSIGVELCWILGKLTLIWTFMTFLGRKP